MTYRVGLFLVSLAFQFILASTISLEKIFIPQIDCNDLNNNGHPDFIAVDHSLTPQTLYHIEYKDSNIEFLWEYSIPIKENAYFSNMILGDFENDETLELIVSSYQDGKEEIFYIFSINNNSFNTDPPKILRVQKSRTPITNPRNIYAMSKDSAGRNLFVITQGSPNRIVIMCEYIDGEIHSVGSVGNDFVRNSKGPIELSLGNFDSDSIEDIFILSNGIDPEGYFIFSDGSNKNEILDNYPPVRLLKPKGIDINFDGIDDLIMVSKDGKLLSNIWEKEFIPLSENQIKNILINLDNGLIHVDIISQKGKMDNITIDPLTKGILTMESNESKFLKEEFNQTYSMMNQNYIVSVHDGENPELWFSTLNFEKVAENITINSVQTIYSTNPDYVINIGETFIHSIIVDSAKEFIHFTGEQLPNNMDFNLDNIQLEWTPKGDQLGFHDFSYTLELRERGKLELEIENDKKMVSQIENMVEEKNEDLIYVNDYVRFNDEQDTIILVNKEYFEWIIPINDNNIDASFELQILEGEETAKFVFLEPTDSDQLSDSMKIESEKVANTSINNYNTKFFWTPDTKEEEYRFSLRTSDGYTSDTLDFLVIVHPEIDLSMNTTEYVITVNQLISIPVELGQSPPSESYFYKLINSPENMWITKNGVINWVPFTTQVDDYSFEIEVSDGMATATLQYNIYVNAIPVISTRPSEKHYINRGDSLSFILESFDMNTDATMQWSLLDGPKEMLLSPEGVLQWYGEKLDYHYYEIQLTDGIDSIKWEGSIYVNDPPKFISEPITFISEDIVYNYPLKAEDENLFSPENSNNENNIEFSLVQGPEGMAIDNDILLWENKKKRPNEHSIIVIASDGIEDTPQKFELLVNSPPMIISKDSVSIQRGDSLKFNIEAYDPNTTDILSYSIEEIIYYSGMRLEKNTGKLIWEPQKSDIGQHYFEVIVKDGNRNSNANQKLQIFVYDSPIFIGDTLREAFVGLEYADFFTAEDMFGERLKNLGSIIIENTTINDYELSEYGLYFQWTPKKIDIGNHKIELILTDKYGFTNNSTINISVFKNPCYQCDNTSKDTPADSTGN